MTMIALRLAAERKALSEEELGKKIQAMLALPALMRSVLDNQQETIYSMARTCNHAAEPRTRGPATWRYPRGAIHVTLFTWRYPNNALLFAPLSPPFRAPCGQIATPPTSSTLGAASTSRWRWRERSS